MKIHNHVWFKYFQCDFLLRKIIFVSHIFGLCPLFVKHYDVLKKNFTKEIENGFQFTIFIIDITKIRGSEVALVGAENQDTIDDFGQATENIDLQTINHSIFARNFRQSSAQERWSASFRMWFLLV